MTVQQLYETWSPLLYRRCLKLLKNHEAAWDAVQTLFEKLVQRPQLLDRVDSPVAYLHRMATYHCLNLIRKDRRLVRDFDFGLLASPEPPTDQPLAQMVVNQVLATLPARVRLVGWLRHVDQLSLDEIADYTGLSYSGVRKNLSRFQQLAKPYKERIL